MHSEHATHVQTPAPAHPAEAIKSAIGTWRTLTIDLPLRMAAETMRFTGHRLQAQADHLTAMVGCGSLKDAAEIQAAFLTKGLADYQTEAAALSHDVTVAALAKAA